MLIFFWHGSTLGFMEYVCISSFVKHGFEVRVFSYNDLVLPDSVILMDASEILPFSDLSKYTQAGISHNLAAFSDAFRYQVIKKKGGWWFDSDVICLVDSGPFSAIIDKKSIKISLGYESPVLINGAVLYIDNHIVLQKILDELESVGTEFEWGDIGPKLITRVINNLQLTHLVDPSFYYYAIYEDYQRLYDPKCLKWCQEMVGKSFALHLWNDLMRRYKIPKNIMPPAGSFLHKIFLDVCPQFASEPTLEYETIKVLFDYYNQKGNYDRLLNIEKSLKENFIISGLLKFRKILKQSF